MSVELLVQILGGLTGIGVAWTMNYFVERKQRRIEAEAEARHRAEIEAIRKQALKR
jgi:hypothetical protein